MLRQYRHWGWVACAALLAPCALAQTRPATPSLNVMRTIARSLAPTVELPAEQARYGAAVPIRVRAPASTSVKHYLVEVEAWDAQAQTWSPAAQLPLMPAADGSGQSTLEANWFAQHAADAAKCRLRARVDDPVGPWSDWRSFERKPAAVRSAAVAAAAASVLRAPQTATGGAASVMARQGPRTGAALLESAMLSSGNQNQKSQFELRVRQLRVGPGQQIIRLKVWNGIQPLDFRAYIDGPVNVDWRREKLQWWFKFESRGDAARRSPPLLRWELSKAPFPAWGDWKPLAGFGLTGMVERRGSNQDEFVVDVAALAPRPPDWAATHPPALYAHQQAAGGAKVAVPGAAVSKKPTASPASSLPADLDIARASSGPGIVAASPAFSSGLVAVAVALPSLYLRVVPVDGTGQPVGRPSNAVELHFGEIQPQPGFKFPFDPPAISFVSYRPVRPYTADWQCWVIANESIKVMEMTVANKGDHKNLCEPKDSSLLDDFVDAFGSFIGFFKDFVNWASGFYSSIKSGLISAVASAIPGCSDSPPCKGALEMGLNAGLAALGMPPELPDFEQLEAMGEGYLAEVISQQAAQTGFPGADLAAKEATKKLIEQGKQAMSSGVAGSGSWVPDPNKQYKPLQFVVDVRNDLATPTTAVNMLVTETTSSRYVPQTVPIPSLAPGKEFKIAIALEPTADPRAWMDLLPTTGDINMFDMSVYNAKKAQAEKALAQWRDDYTKGSFLKIGVEIRPQVNASTAYAQPLLKNCDPGKPQCLIN